MAANFQVEEFYAYVNDVEAILSSTLCVRGLPLYTLWF